MNSFSRGSLALAGVALLLAAATPSSGQLPPLDVVMQEKLDRTQRLLEAVVLQRHVTVEHYANELRLLSDASTWTSLESSEYLLHALDFQDAADELMAEARIGEWRRNRGRVLGTGVGMRHLSHLPHWTGHGRYRRGPRGPAAPEMTTTDVEGVRRWCSGTYWLPSISANRRPGRSLAPGSWPTSTKRRCFCCTSSATRAMCGEPMQTVFAVSPTRSSGQSRDRLDGLLVAESGERMITRIGQPHDEILGYAKTHDIDLIVMGTHGYGRIEHLVLGSVAERVVRAAPCPVMTVRGGTEE